MRAVEAWTTPRHTAIGAARVDGADFDCAHRAPLSRPDMDVREVFLAVFAHRPAWLKAALVARNRVAAAFGLDVATDAEILRPDARAGLMVGERIGGWPIHFLSDDELVAGRDNPHLDFRLSIMKAADHRSAIVSTLCWVRNAAGRGYLSVVAPLHRIGVRRLIASAVEHGRL